MIDYTNSAKQREADTALLFKIVAELQDFCEELTLSENEEMQLSDLFSDLVIAVNQLSNI